MSRNEWTSVWHFNTAHFQVSLDWAYESDPDTSWDDTGETDEKIANGEWTSFTFRVIVYCDGREVGADYLSNSIYANPREFYTEHLGIAAKSRADNCRYGCYFTDMVHQAIAEARKTLCNAPKLRCA